MAAEAKAMIEAIIAFQSKGDPAIAKLTKTKLILKGINPDKIIDSPNDDPAIIAKLKALGTELGVSF